MIIMNEIYLKLKNIASFCSIQSHCQCIHLLLLLSFIVVFQWQETKQKRGLKSRSVCVCVCAHIDVTIECLRYELNVSDQKYIPSSMLANTEKTIYVHKMMKASLTRKSLEPNYVFGFLTSTCKRLPMSMLCVFEYFSFTF